MSPLLRYTLYFLLLMGCNIAFAQGSRIVEMGETLEEFIEENHIEEIEDMIHHLTSSSLFVNQFVEKEKQHLLVAQELHRKDVRIGRDIDIYVKHFSEHQSYTMILVPISIYSAAIYDTLLFSVLEVTDCWLQREYPYAKLSNDSIKSSLLSLKNHDLFASHLYEQALEQTSSEMGRFKIHVQESYITSNTVHEQLSHLSKEEREKIKRKWSLLKKALSHNIDLNVELNMYVFGFNDMEVIIQHINKPEYYKITPSNIFTRHHFEGE